jgi:cytochrome c peroxidase
MRYSVSNGRLIALGAWFFATSAWAGGATVSLEVSVAPQFNGAPLEFNVVTNRTAAGQTVSVTRLDFLLSDMALRRADGVWVGQKNWFSFLSAVEGKTNFALRNIPPGNYDRLRFRIGLEPSINHGDAAQWAAGHPLNPAVNHLYWSWSREYVFLALEGRWQKGGEQSGFSFHLATDRELMTVELPAKLELSASRKLPILLDVAKIFSAPNLIPLSDDSQTTHSRPKDALADQLRQNIERSFAAGDVREYSPVAALTRETRRIEIAPDATPYRFTFPKSLPRPSLPVDNPLTGEGVALGGKLFFERQLSADKTESCAECHHPRAAFSDTRRFSRGVDGKLGARHAMPLLNLAWKNSFFWDGRAATLREQVLQPIQNPIEMHESLFNAVKKLSGEADYRRLFRNAFGTTEITPDKMARALEQFLLVQISFDAKYDRVMSGSATFTEEERRGFELFNTEYDPYHGQYGADCFHCHGGPLFQSQNFANNGLDAAFADLGRFTVTHRAGDEGKFAVPSLRNVALTAPYMHDGRFKTLEEAIEHYCTGMKRGATLDPNLAKHSAGGVPLNAADKRALAAFLKTLTDDRFLSEGAPPPAGYRALRLDHQRRKATQDQIASTIPNGHAP